MAAVESTMLNCLEYRENKIDICVHETYHARTHYHTEPEKAEYSTKVRDYWRIEHRPGSSTYQAQG